MSNDAQRLRNTMQRVDLHAHRFFCNNLQHLCRFHSLDYFSIVTTVTCLRTCLHLFHVTFQSARGGKKDRLLFFECTPLFSLLIYLFLFSFEDVATTDEAFSPNRSRDEKCYGRVFRSRLRLTIQFNFVLLLGSPFRAVSCTYKVSNCLS